jgi:hypothetical protein
MPDCNIPCPTDTEYVLLLKLLRLFGGSPMSGDGRPTLLRKILQEVVDAGSGITPTPSGGGALNFQDSADLADGVLFNLGGIAEVGRISGGDFTMHVGDVVATAGDFEATAGDFNATAGDFNATAGDFNATAGDFNATAGDFNATAGDFNATAGDFNSTVGDLILASGLASITSPMLVANAPGVTINQNWNNAAAALFVGLDVDVADFASPAGNASLVFRGVVNGTDVFRVRKDGTIYGSRFTGLSTTSATSHTLSDAGTNTAPNLLVVSHETSGVPLVNFGGTFEFEADSTTTADRPQARIQSLWSDPIDASRSAKLDFYTVFNAALTRGLSITGSQSLFADGTVALPAASFINEPSTGFYRSGAGSTVFSRLGVAHTALVESKIIKYGVVATDTSTVGADITDATGWTSTNWTGDYTVGFTHTPGNTSILSRAIAGIVAGKRYKVEFTISARTVGTLTCLLGGTTYATSLDTNAVYVYYVVATNNSALQFSPLATFDGKVSAISVMEVTASVDTTRWTDSAGAESVSIRANTQALLNTFLGRGAGEVTFGSRDTAIGANSLLNNMAGIGNTAMGAESTYSLTEGDYNSAFGDASLKNCVTGDQNCAFGYQALTTTKLGIGSCAFGYKALYVATGASASCAFGSQSLVALTSGTKNTALGYYTLSAITTNGSCTAVGYEALKLATGTNNTAVGDACLDALTSGGSSTAVGKDALSAVTTYSNNTAVGYQALKVYNRADGCAFGYNASVANVNGLYNSAFGVSALATNIGGYTCSAFGFEALKMNTGDQNSAFGALTLDANTFGMSNSAFGMGALGANTEGNDNCAFGYLALSTKTVRSQNCAFGSSAISGGGTTGSRNNAFGYYALAAVTTSYNNAFGYYALGSLTSGSRNCVFGHDAAASFTTGNDCCGFGYNTMMNSTTGRHRNCAFGSESMGWNGALLTAGTDNCAFGYQTLRLAYGDHNIGIGSGAGDNITSGARNTILGGAAGAALTTGTDNILLGYGVAASAVGANYEINLGSTYYGLTNVGRAGIGVAAPSAALHIKAGTTAASTAPLKFTSGSLLTIAEAGAVEFLTDAFYATITTGPTRKEIKLCDTYYGEMYIYNNASASVVVATNEYHALDIISTGGLNNGFTFTAGTRAPVASVEENVAGVSYKVNTTGNHNLSTGDIVTHNGFTVAAYKGAKTVLSTPSGTQYTVAGTFTVTDTGTVIRGSRLVAGTNAAGKYKLSFTASVSAETATTEIKIEGVKNTTDLDNVAVQADYHFSGEHIPQAAAGLVSVAAGDHLWLQMKNLSDSSDFTMTNIGACLTRI